MKRKVLAMMMSLTLAMAVTACGGSDTETDAADTAVEETVDDTAEADEAEAEDVAAEDATEEAEEDLGPLYSIEAAEAPDVAGTTWHFVAAKSLMQRQQLVFWIRTTVELLIWYLMKMAMQPWSREAETSLVLMSM